MKPEQASAPLWEALCAYRGAGRVRAHVPAHRGGPGQPGWRGEFGEVLGLDATEIPELDDLHAPRGAIARAQELAADLYGADRAFFSVGGTTAGVLALLWAVAGPGEEVLVSRDAHRSVVAGLILTGARPRYVLPPVHPEFSLPLPPTASQWREALEGAGRVRAVVCTYPTYHGMAGNLRALVEAAHARDIPVVVDAAHGAHLLAHPALPADPLAAGADAAVYGMHKSGGSLTQTAVVALRGPRVDAARVAEGLRLWQSSSPSFLLLASLDLARREMALRGRALWNRSLDAAARVRARVRAPVLAPGPGEEWFHDPTRITVWAGAPGAPATEAAARLAAEWGVQVEYADLENVLVILGPGWTEEEEERLARALAALPVPPPPRPETGRPWGIPEQVLTPAEAARAPKEWVPLHAARGRVAAGVVAPSPPGVPVWLPGEAIGGREVEYVEGALRAGIACPGVEADGKVAVVARGGTG